VDDLKKAFECYERALKIALDNGYMDTALLVYNNLGVSLPAEENERILECYEKGSELAKKVGHISYQSVFGGILTWMNIGMGNMNKAMSLAEESVALARKTGSVIGLLNSLAFLGFVYHVLGEWDTSEQYYKEASSISQRLKDFQWIAQNHICVGWLHLDKGEYAKAKEHLEKACEIYEKAGVKYEQMRFSQWLIWTYIDLEEIEKAKNLIDKLHKFGLEMKYKELIAGADALRGMLFRAQKKWKKSIKHFEKSLLQHEALNARRWNVYWFAKMVLCEYARVYLERNQKGDREKAHNLLNQSLEIFQKLGAKKDIEKILAKKKLLTA